MNTEKMKKAAGIGLLLMVAAGTFSGCGAYRSASGISVPDMVPQEHSKDVIVTDGTFPNYDCNFISTIDASVKKLTIFNKNPTKDHADFVLAEKARRIGANAVTEVTYKSGIGFSTWGYMDAEGVASKCDFSVPKQASK